MGCTASSAEEQAQIKAAKAAQKPLSIFEAGTKVQEVEVNFSKNAGVTVVNKNSPQKEAPRESVSGRQMSTDGPKKNPFLKTTAKDYGVNTEETNAPLYYATTDSMAPPERPSNISNSPLARESSMKKNPLKLKTKPQEEPGELYYASDSPKAAESEIGSAAVTMLAAKRVNPLAKK